MLPRIRLAEMTREELRQVAPACTVVLPVGALEQHGPHLPVLVDDLVVEAVALRAAEAAAQSVPVTVAPVLPYGSSDHHLAFFALSLRSETLLRVLMDLGRSLAQVGFRRLFLLNGHGGNDDLIRQAARDLSLDYPLHVGAASYWSLAAGELAAAGAAAAGSVPGHAGGFETALTLALRPDLVRSERYPQAGGFRAGAGDRPPYFVQHPGLWERSGGYSEAPRDAGADLGERCLAAAAAAVAGALIRFHREAE